MASIKRLFAILIKLINCCMQMADERLLCVVTVCNCAVHKKCHDKILGKCTGSAKDSRETKVRQFFSRTVKLSSARLLFALIVFLLVHWRNVLVTSLCAPPVLL